MKITLIFPCVPGSADYHDKNSLLIRAFELLSVPLRPYFSLGNTNYTPPLSLLMLAAVTPLDIEVEIIDERLDEIDYDQDTDLVGISVVTRTAPRAYLISREYRNRGIPVVLGGIHPSILPSEATKYADAIVVGEGESVWPQVVEDVCNNTLQKIYKGIPQTDLDRLPHPRRDVLRSPQRYLTTKVTTVSRGCPNTCTFCGAGFAVGKKYRVRSITNVIEELEQIPGVGTIFLDDNMGWNIQYAKDFLKALIPLGIKWAGATSLNVLGDPEYVSLLSRSGCILLNLGFESIDPNVIRAIKKHNTNDPSQYKRIIQRVHDEGVPIHGAFMFGFDQDDKSVFQETADFINETSIEEPVIHVLMPYPGTEIFKQYDEEGRLLHKNWERYDTAIGNVVYVPKQMSVEELANGHLECMREVFSTSSILSRYTSAGTLVRAGVGSLAGLAYNFYQSRRAKLEEELLRL